MDGLQLHGGKPDRRAGILLGLSVCAGNRRRNGPVVAEHLPDGSTARLDHRRRTPLHAFDRPETWVTLRTGHMGNTFRLLAGGVDAVESEFGHGGARRFVARLLDGEA